MNLRTRKAARLSLAGMLLLAAMASAQTVTITSPANNSTVGSPLTVTARATSSSAVTLTQLYVDGVKKYEVRSASLSTSVAAAAGQRRIVVQSYDAAGHVFKATVYATVGSTSTSTSTSTSSTSTTTTAPSTAATFADIDHMTGWESCDRCAGAAGAGPTTQFSMQQNISTPAIDGRAAQFNLTPTTSYNQALWWKQLGAQDGASHFVYDLYFYLKSSTNVQALEFDANQSLGGNKYIFGTQCDIRGKGAWEVWDYNLKWVSTGIACSAPSTYTWHHLTWEFQRVNGKMLFIALTYDGVKHYVNRYQAPQPSSAHELNVAFQMDSGSALTPYSTWVDKVSLKYW